MEAHELRKPITADELLAYHAIRRSVLFESRGLIGVYDEHHPDEHADGHHPLVLVHSGEIIGVIRVDIAGREAIFRRVAIRADRQRSGHGARMLALAEEFARRNGCVNVRSSVDPDAVGFYRRCGYIELGSVKQTGGLLMSKRLGEP
jgi:GNAT superfamily N-acetyltransferase